MTLNEAEIGREYIVSDIETDGDEDMKSFLFSLGCYSGETMLLTKSAIWWSQSRMPDITLILS